MDSLQESTSIKMTYECQVRIELISGETITLELESINLSKLLLVGSTSLGDQMLIHFKNIKSIEQLDHTDDTSIEIRLSGNVENVLHDIHKKGKDSYKKLRTYIEDTASPEELSLFFKQVIEVGSKHYGKLTNQLDELGHTIKETVKPYAENTQDSLIDLYTSLKTATTENETIQEFLSRVKRTDIQKLLSKLGFSSSPQPEQQSGSDNETETTSDDHSKSDDSISDLINQLLFISKQSSNDEQTSEDTQEKTEIKQDDDRTILADVSHLFASNTSSNEQGDEVESSNEQQPFIQSIIKQFTNSSETKNNEDSDQLNENKSNPGNLVVNDLVQSLLKQFTPNETAKKEDSDQSTES